MYIIFQRKYVDYGQVPVAASILKCSEIGVTSKIGLSLDRIVQSRLHCKVLSRGAVKLKQDRAGTGFDYRYAGAGGGDRCSVRQPQRDLGCLSSSCIQIVTDPDVINSVYPGWKTACILGGSSGCLCKVGIGLGQLQMPAPHCNIRGNGIVIAGPVVYLAVPDVLGLYHGDGSLTGISQSDKLQ